jgi:phosphatidylserine/phosphatidylglycerophosphate/cardiolipin synthase-like enzyme
MNSLLLFYFFTKNAIFLSRASMVRRYLSYLLTGGLGLLALAWGGHFGPNTSYQVCFTPDQHCTRRIVALVNQAKKTIHVQGYSFTSSPIAHALYRAHKRGVKVSIILDSSDFDCAHFSYASFFIRHHMPIWEDKQLNIAHNKVMIVDGNTVETGSFNYTKSAQYYNAENVLLINDTRLAQSYLDNWQRRKKNSQPVGKDPCPQLQYWH